MLCGHHLQESWQKLEEIHLVCYREQHHSLIYFFEGVALGHLTREGWKMLPGARRTVLLDTTEPNQTKKVKEH